MKREAQFLALVLAVASAAVLLGVALASFLPVILAFLLDLTPRTPFSTSALAVQIRTALPAESLGFLGLAAVAALLGFAADRLP